MKKEANSKTKAHQIYRLKLTEEFPKGEIVPGVTTIIDSQLGWNKRILIAWARRTALAGEDPDKVLSQAGDIGIIVHALIEAHVKNQIEKQPYKYIAHLKEFSQVDIDKAETAFLAFLDWEKHNQLRYIASEKQVISETYRYGGTIDILAEKEGELWLIDPKSSKSIYSEFIIQVVAYRKAYEEQTPMRDNWRIKECHLLHLGKENGEFSDHKISDTQQELAWQAFLYCRKLYDIHKKL